LFDFICSKKINSETNIIHPISAILLATSANVKGRLTVDSIFKAAQIYSKKTDSYYPFVFTNIFYLDYYQRLFIRTFLAKTKRADGTEVYSQLFNNRPH